jgi:succinate dehydrogenase / fumarate reductase, cytochrome b subunit
MKQTRPIYLDLRQIRQPLPAIISLLHRISGVLLFLAIPWLLTLFQASLASAESFTTLQNSLGVKLALFSLLAAYSYHLVAGLRFLLLDLHWGASLKSARRSAWIVTLASTLTAVLIGSWLW